MDFVIMLHNPPLLFVVVLLVAFGDHVENAHQHHADKGRDPADAPCVAEKSPKHLHRNADKKTDHTDCSHIFHDSISILIDYQTLCPNYLSCLSPYPC